MTPQSHVGSIIALLYFRPMNSYEKENEDPVEAYNREFQRKRWERSQEKKRKQENLERFFFRTAWFISMPIVLFAFILVLDSLLPPVMLEENVISGWQQRNSRTRFRQSELKSFIKTDHYVIRVDHAVHLNFPYYDSTKPRIILHRTPIFDIPLKFTFDDHSIPWMEVPGTIHSLSFPLKWLLLISSIFTLIRKDFSKLSYALCFMPALLLAIVLLIMI